jgi:hypothetical protein
LDKSWLLGITPLSVDLPSLSFPQAVPARDDRPSQPAIAIGDERAVALNLVGRR